MSDSLSIIVPVRNAEGTLKRQIERLLDMLPDLTPRFDIVIVDDASSDHTVELARDLACEYPQVRLIRHDEPCGRERAIHTGRTWAQGKIVLAPESLTEVLSPTELRRQLSQHSPTISSTFKPASPARIDKLPEPATNRQRGNRSEVAQPAVLSDALARTDEAHANLPPYRHHAAAFLEHLTRLALGE